MYDRRMKSQMENEKQQENIFGVGRSKNVHKKMGQVHVGESRKNCRTDRDCNNRNYGSHHAG